MSSTQEPRSLAEISNTDDDTSSIVSEEHVESVFTTFVPPTGDNHSHTFIFLHGREDFGEYMAEDFLGCKLSDSQTLAQIFPSMKWVFPTAKLRLLTRRQHEFGSFAEKNQELAIISQWFDVWDIGMPSEKQELMKSGLMESIADILEIIKEEAKIVPMENIILGGISQGCATAILLLVSSGIKLGGFVGLCSWLPYQATIHEIMSTTRDKTELTQWISGIFFAPTAEDIDTEECNEEIGLDGLLGGLSLSDKIDFSTPIFLALAQDDETVPFSTHGETLQ